MIRNITAYGLLAALVCLGTGCASIVTGTHRKVTFNSNPSGAKVTIATPKGKVIREGVTPFTTSLMKGQPYFVGRKYVVTFSKEGYFDTKQEVKATLNGWYLGNLVFGGLVGLIVVDPLTGAMWTLPKDVTTTLNPSNASTSLEPQLRIVNLDDIPSSDRSKLVRLN